MVSSIRSLTGGHGPARRPSDASGDRGAERSKERKNGPTITTVTSNIATGIVVTLAVGSAGFGVVALQTPSPAPLATGRVAVDASTAGAAIPPRLYGIFY